MKVMSRKEKTVFGCCILINLICILPLYAYARYTVPLADDFSMAGGPYKAWVESKSVLAVFGAAWDNVKYAYINWSGGYLCALLQSLLIGLGDFKWYFLSSWLVISVMLASLYLFAEVFFHEYIGIKKSWTFFVSTIMVLFIINYIPDVYDAFFWYDTGIAYTVGMSLKIVLSSLILKELVVLEDNNSWGRTILLIIGTFLAPSVDTAFSSVVFFLVCTLLCIRGLLYKRKRVQCIMIEMACCCGWMVTLLAPGNMNRQSSMYGESTNFIATIWESLQRGVDSISENINLPLILVTMLVVPVIYHGTKNSVRKFCYPAILTILSVGVYSSLYAPWIFSRGIEAPSPYGGDSGYVLNIFWTVFVILWFVNVTYWIGWGAQRLEIVQYGEKDKNRLYGAFYGIILFIILFWSANLEHVMEYQSFRRYWHLLNGNAQSYYSQMLEREKLMLEGADDVLVVDSIYMPIPSAGAGDITADEENWVNKAVQYYYDLEKGIRTNEE